MPVPWELADRAGRAVSRSGTRASAGARHGPEQVLTALAPWGCGVRIGRGSYPTTVRTAPTGAAACRGSPAVIGKILLTSKSLA